MDRAGRNALRSAVVQCRRLIEEEVWRQLESQFGVTPAGKVLRREEFAPSATEAELAKREDILAAINHIESGGTARKQAVEQFVREVSFTILNRLAALKLMEDPSRALIPQSLGAGKESQGFRLFQRVSPECCRSATNGGTPDGGYRLYLQCLFDDLAAELPSLFDLGPAESVIFPSDACLMRVIGILNNPQIASVWGSDETIGWIYQYFTPKELRERARKESQAPRNSYELAFRNQFYTPRYVVQFLTDNTLGRIWHEMQKGKTRLKRFCRFLVWQPDEVFLEPGQGSASSGAAASRSSEAGDGGAAADHAVAIAHRPKKDPRDLRILDPACGSGHFLLYAYDLLTIIYEEAWEDPDSPPFSETGRTLRADYPERHELRAALPGLILRHNLYGIDIDPRAVQIAGLALWLRAERSFAELGLGVAGRPQIKRTNIVSAEPLPGEQELLSDLQQILESKVLRQLVERVFAKMKLAGEAGTLLKIEAEIAGDVAEAKRLWLAAPRQEQLSLFPAADKPKPEQLALFDFSGVTDEKFWSDAEVKVLEALQTLAGRARDGGSALRRMFVDDTMQGFAFIDVCRKRFDVVVMNPPFGEPSKPSKAYITKAYPRTKNDLFSAFVERGLELLKPEGMLGAITSRTGFFLTSFQKWREQILLSKARPTVVADLGQGVLDTAMVETAAYCLRKTEASEGEGLR